MTTIAATFECIFSTASSLALAIPLLLGFVHPERLLKIPFAYPVVLVDAVYILGLIILQLNDTGRTFNIFSII